MAQWPNKMETYEGYENKGSSLQHGDEDIATFGRGEYHGRTNEKLEVCNSILEKNTCFFLSILLSLQIQMF